MKEDILEEIKLKTSRIRVIFATTSLGMEVDAPHIINIIHIRPPSDLESYVQEIGRAGRDKEQPDVSLYNNNSDLSSGIISEGMRKYCMEKGFEFHDAKQNHCCSNCEPPEHIPVHIEESDNRNIYRKINSNINNVIGELNIILDNWIKNYNMYDYSIEDWLSERIANECEYILNCGDMLDMFYM